MTVTSGHGTGGLFRIYSRLNGVGMLPPGVEAAGKRADTRNSRSRSISAARALEVSLGQLQYSITSRSAGLGAGLFPTVPGPEQSARNRLRIGLKFDRVAHI